MRVIVILIFLLVSNSLKGQLSGSIYDKDNGEKLSFVNIWYSNDEVRLGTTSDETGSFKFSELDTSRFLTFNKVGYEVLTLKPVSNICDVYLNKIKENRLQTTEELDEPRRGRMGIDFENLTSIVSLSTTKSEPTINAQYFAADEFHSYQLDKINLSLKNKKKSLINIRIYEATEDQKPGNLLYFKDIIRTISVGKEVHKINVKDLDIRIPENGFFIGIEKLILDQNKISLEETDFNTNQEVTVNEYYPSLKLYKNDNSNIIFSYINGDWRKWNKSDLSLGINLTLKR
ncbi:carboxypeptidase-like regulatory domain-containing protein [Marivirga tractuosa]|uniref:carboxypeptidase-like regulatory domain-containing protein n=1 Tax=Marivirga tractuosa TaxID=1006 RepID=UPI0035CF508A